MERSLDEAEKFDAVVVGTGFGGSVMAYRLADAGMSVCVLERGRAYPPGTFPRTPRDMGKNFWEPDKGLYGLFDIWSFRNMESIVASALGGGSHIYANVLLRKDEKWFVKDKDGDQRGEHWPITYEDLERHYGDVVKVLDPVKYPIDHAPYDKTPKTIAFRGAAHATGTDAIGPPLAITFGNDSKAPIPGELIRDGRNLHGSRGARYTCRLVGECDMGCNWGSKNTLDFNYLTMAQKHGAQLCTRCEVKRFEPIGRNGEDGYFIWYIDRSGEDDDPAQPTHWHPGTKRKIAARRLVLAAGCFGTTLLMLRMQDVAALQGLSPALGTRFSGNGDFLSYAAKCREWDGDRESPRLIDPTYGPVITSSIRYPDHVDDPTLDETQRGMYVQDGGFPNLAAWLVEAAAVKSGASRSARVALTLLKQRLFSTSDSKLSAEASMLLGGAEWSGSSVPLLTMGRDFPDGTMRLNRKRKLDVDWKKSGPFFDQVRRATGRLATAMGAADYKVNISWILRRFLTVHPVGGCPMADAATPDRGVVDPHGKVFGYENLYIADGSVMPGPVGPNPSLTIAALANRTADAVIAARTPTPMRRSRRFPPAGERAAAPPEPPTGISFTEEMSGYVTFEDGKDYDAGFDRGKEDGTALGFHLDISIDDVDSFLEHRDHPADAQGYVDCAQLGGRRPVGDGIFNLFALRGTPPRKRMLYHLPFTGQEGDLFTLMGFKVIEDDFGPDLWPDTTTLYTQIVGGHLPPSVEGHVPPGDRSHRVKAAGILHISPRAFLHQLRSISADGPREGEALVTFIRFFLAGLADEYSPILLGRIGEAVPRGEP
jgi:cholesterol oxidase